jgi:hypothetical protein
VNSTFLILPYEKDFASERVLWFVRTETDICSRCARDVDRMPNLKPVICTGCLTLTEDVAETAAFAAACGRAAGAASTREIAERAQHWAELALLNLVRRRSLGYDSAPLFSQPPTGR